MPQTKTKQKHYGSTPDTITLIAPSRLLATCSGYATDKNKNKTKTKPSLWVSFAIYHAKVYMLEYACSVDFVSGIDLDALSGSFGN